MDPLETETGFGQISTGAQIRDPLAVPELVQAARERPMSERLELALSWNLLAAELRAGLAIAIKRSNESQ